METFLFFLFVTVASYLFAKVEIAVEGAEGWAEKLPTWKLRREHLVSRVFFANKPATGYHVWMNLFILFFVHIVYLFVPVSLALELKLISFVIFFFIIEDILWFILNPAFGLKNFKKDKIWWHEPNWLLIAPRDYFISIPIAIVLYYLSGIL